MVRSKNSPSLLIRLLGDPVDTLLENRVLNGTMLLVFVTGLLSTIQNSIIHNSPRMLISTGFSALGGLAGYLISRYLRKWKPLIPPILIFFMVLLAASWITQAGSNGTIGYYYFLFLTTVIVLVKGAWKLLVLIFTGLQIVALLFIELLHPGLIMPYETPMQRFTDIAFSLIFCLMMSAAMVYLVYREYQRERGINEQLLSQVTKEKTAVEQSVKQKQRLLSMICHDIANALTVAQGSVSLLKLRIDKTAVELPALDRTQFAVNKIKEIVNSVRLLEAVEQGRLPLQLEPVNLASVMDNVMLIFKEKLAERAMRLECPPKGPENFSVIAEPRILANQVISNLVSNAIRFSHPGSAITIELTTSPEKTSISVSDTGIGIPSELLDRLFDPSARTTRPGTNGEPGTGFGMLTAKSFVELFGGTIAVASKTQDEFPENHGTTVTIMLKSAQTDRTSRPVYQN